MTDKELGNPGNESSEVKPEESNLDNNTNNESVVELSESTNIPTSEPLDLKEDTIIPPSLDAQNLSDNASAPTPTSSGNSKIWMGLSLVLAVALVIVLIKPPFSGGSNKAVATVNGVDITKDKLYDQLVTIGGAQTLENLITEELIEQEVKKANITVTDADQTKELESLKKSLGTEEAFNQALTQAGMTLEDLKKEMSVQVKIRKLVEPQVKVTDADIKKYFEENVGAFDTAEQVRASHILVATKAEAESILKELKGGADFATLATAKSLDTRSKEKGGDMDFFARGAVGDENFENAAFALDKGQLSGVVQSSGGFHIIKATDHKDAHKATLEEKSTEIKELLTSQQITTLSSTWLTTIKEKADIKNTLEKEEVPATEAVETPVK
ncbi:foldase protein PrsA [Paenibacillus glacialis]|uniref:PpiC domain-containing protein n=1 Tax=Paenibacillus glacialis TaxID=494026 RepID=A0A162K6J9_9BACL|nr:peptidylprolyl isomerase [Paenibacillus glacialis]OAB43746.1 hypothetical protein PGLA_08165 [Paenibacillus glacialis]